MKKAKMTSGADFIMTLGLALGRLRLIPTQPSSLITFTFDHWLEPRRNISEFERSASKLNVNLNDFQLWPSWGRDDWDDVRCDVRNASSGDSGFAHDQQRASSSTISTTASTSSLKIKNQRLVKCPTRWYLYIVLWVSVLIFHNPDLKWDIVHHQIHLSLEICQVHIWKS